MDFEVPAGACDYHTHIHGDPERHPSKLAPGYPDVVPLAKALIAANPDRVVWGTDWPHPDGFVPPGRTPTDVTPPLQVDDGRLLNQHAVWAPDPEIREQILVNNPARIYQF